jgi:hypothetical protein
MNSDNPEHLDDREIVKGVRDILGARLTACVAGVAETSIVQSPRNYSYRSAKTLQPADSSLTDEVAANIASPGRHVRVIRRKAPKRSGAVR